MRERCLWTVEVIVRKTVEWIVDNVVSSAEELGRSYNSWLVLSTGGKDADGLTMGGMTTGETLTDKVDEAGS